MFWEFPDIRSSNLHQLSEVQQPMEELQELVVVTGATGFLAAHIIEQLLALGYKVRATTRNPNDRVKTKHLWDLPQAEQNLTLVKADLNNARECEEACLGASYVIHAASPYTLKVEDPWKDLINPAVEGSVNFVQAAHKTGVKRVVLTSSIAAVTENPRTGYTFTESDWNQTSSPTHNPYYYSKTEAEKKATEYAKANGVDLVVINPFVIIGTPLNLTDNASAEIFERIVAGEFPAIFDFHWGLVDVADVAAAHVAAMTAPSANGRYLCIGGTITMKRLCHFLATHFPEYPVPKTELDGAGGTALLKFSSYLESRDVGSYMRSNIGQILSYDCSKIKKDLNFEFRDLDQSIIDTVKALIRFGKLPELRPSHLTPVALEQIGLELKQRFGESVSAAGLVQFLIDRNDYHLCPTKAIRDIEQLQKVHIVSDNINVASAVPPAKTLLKERLEYNEKRMLQDIAAAKLGDFTINAEPPKIAVINQAAADADRLEAVPPAFEELLREAERSLLEAAGPEGWKTVRLDDGCLLETRKGKLSCFRGTTRIHYDANLIQTTAPMLVSMSNIDPLFVSGEVITRYNDGTELRLHRYEGQSCVIKAKVHFLFLLRCKKLDDGTRVNICQSVVAPQYDRFTAVPGSMLGYFEGTGWVIRPNDNAGDSKCTYVVQVNFEKIPQAVVNVVAKQIPMTAAKLRRYLTGK